MHHFIDRGDVKQETTNLELLMADSGQVMTQCIMIYVHDDLSCS